MSGEFVWTDGENGCPVLDGALASLECICDSLHDGGDHWIIIGRVTQAESGNDGAPCCSIAAVMPVLKESGSDYFVLSGYIL